MERHRELVSRAEIVERLWGDGVFVDAEMGINTAVRKVRQVLGDAPDAPTFIETISGRGYRFVADIEIAGTPPATIGSASVTLAVLPFENLGPGQEHHYLADGFTEEATTALGQIDPDHLSVIGRTSVLSYKHTMKSLAEIGRELGATYLVEGSIRAEDRRWRVTVRLIRASDQVQMWSASFDSEPSSILEFQRQLSTAIAEQIRLRLSPDRLASLKHRQSRSVEAYDLYLRGRYLWNQLTPQTNRAAMEHYSRATELDPEYSLAWAGIADLLAASPMTADAPPQEVWPRAGMPRRMPWSAGRRSRRARPLAQWSATGSTGIGLRQRPPTGKPSLWIPVTPSRIECLVSCWPPTAVMKRRGRASDVRASSIRCNR